ncbi:MULTISPECIES: hypothetical protein [unclassified Mesorhizobium]|uniref:hypothetical protein n=1 Tax=unclassified Mesorhizobium TaxID=325217 RepID=UPI001125E040|nr:MULTISPECIES: hypothetical protein [unclassified Mesorhizobium]TPN54952.1 hypothetical protein FJ978_05540 [Mesorhizobium sp. B1-1-7]TPN55569.1 hypothetical protein FJ976_08335 [Mesorhizobium sp. B1-1-9]
MFAPSELLLSFEGALRNSFRSFCILKRAAVVAVSVSMQFCPAVAHSSEEQDVRCPLGRNQDPYLVWKGIADPAQAKLFLRKQLADIGNLNDFSVWLKCQGFEVKVDKSGFHNPSPEAVVIASFVIKGKNRHPLWNERVAFLFGIWPKLYAHNLRIYVRNGHDASRITIEHTVE